MRNSDAVIVVAGADPGSTNFGFAVARLKSPYLLPKTDAQGATKMVPNVEPLVMQRWNIKEGELLTHDENFEPVTLSAGESRGDRLCDYAPLIGRFVGGVPELFEHHESLVWGDGTLPLVVCENQFDHIKSAYAKCEMLVLSHAFRASLEACDARQQLGERINMQAGLKYGLRNDNSLERPERKKKADAVTRELFQELGLTRWSRFLARCDATKQQTHDMCDALLLATQEAINRYEQLARDEIKQRRALIASIPKTPTVKRATSKKEPEQAHIEMVRTKTDAQAFFGQIDAAEVAGQDPLITKPSGGKLAKPKTSPKSSPTNSPSKSPKKARTKQLATETVPKKSTKNDAKKTPKKSRVLKEADKPPLSKEEKKKLAATKEKKSKKAKPASEEQPSKKRKRADSDATKCADETKKKKATRLEVIKLDLVDEVTPQ